MAKRKSTDTIVIHCAATRPSMNVGRKEIDAWHKARGWKKIGYHFVIRRDGTLETGRAVDEVGAHVEGHNSTSVGVCYVGGVNEDSLGPEDNRTPQQKARLESVVRFLLGLYPLAKIVGHCDLNSGKACPSFDVAAWLREIKL